MYRIGTRFTAQPKRLGACVKRASSAVRFMSVSCDYSPWPPIGSVYPPGWKHPRSIAVLGGGLTGLSTAWYLSRWMPNARITVFEASDRLGGWIDTETVPVTTPDGKEGTVSFERGARMIQIPRKGTPKFDDMVFYEMISALGLEKEVLRINRKSPMKNFVYFPDHVVEMPSPTMGLLELAQRVVTEPLLKGLPHALFEGWRAAPQEKSWDSVCEGHERERYRRWPMTFFAPQRDSMSLGAYYSHITGRPDVVDNMLSAMIHGIWGGDVSKLSDGRDPFNHIHDRPNVPPSAQDEYTTLTNEEADLPVMMTEGTQHSYDISWTMDAIDHGHMSFRTGFNTLTDAIAAALENNPMVTIKKNEPVTSIRMHATGVPAIVSKRQVERPQLFEKVISTINASTLASITDNKLPSLADAHAVTIQAVNLWYPTPMLNAPHHGFGYLIPKTVKYELNPEFALGVLFDSDREAIAGYSPDTVPGTKLTVLLGGHYWDDLSPEFIPDSADAIEMAKAVVTRHLGIPQHENDRAVASTKLCKECIPQHYVGHWDRMANAKSELQKAFAGKLAVAGPSYQMPGVLGSIRAGRDLAYYTAGFYPNKRTEAMSPVGDTGLDRFAIERHWLAVRKDSLPMRFPVQHLKQDDPTSLVASFVKHIVLPFMKELFRPEDRFDGVGSRNVRTFLHKTRSVKNMEVMLLKRHSDKAVNKAWSGQDEFMSLIESVEKALAKGLEEIEDAEQRNDYEKVQQVGKRLRKEADIPRLWELLEQSREAWQESGVDGWR